MKPVENYDQLFCTTVKEDNKVIKEVHKDIKELLTVFTNEYSNDKELGEFIRKHYGSTKGK
jgi:hypothetical protein